ncbi:hypothetical protein ABZ471_29985 [Streptomyces sp. NPDC005728]|uniref:hypothetical protein n=1 Tax=Streptomyces sp. NPDC005728 TaxID=3157054 RepID=UPI0033D6D9E3
MLLQCSTSLCCKAVTRRAAGDAAARAAPDAHRSGGAHAAVQRTPHGILLGLVYRLLVVGLAALAVTRPRRTAAPDRALSLRRLQPGHVGDYVARLLVGATCWARRPCPGCRPG